MSVNRSSAVVQHRHLSKESLDFFPTPPWAARALCEWIVTTRRHADLSDLTAWEPACGAGDMARTLEEYFRSVVATDVHDYGFGEVEDFLWPSPIHKTDWIITNPPFKLADQFAATGIKRATRGVAMLVRVSFVEGMARHKNLFDPNPPSDILQFTERVPIIHGRLDRRAASAMGYCWIVWRKHGPRDTRFLWLAPCRKRLERDSDYPVDVGAA